MKGIVLAGGSGTRLSPLTVAVSKQLLPVYDRPMVMFPIQTLRSMGVREILIISTKADQHLFWRLLGDGKEMNLSIQYAVQNEPNGIAEAFLIGEGFVGDDHVALILGDNLFLNSKQVLEGLGHNPPGCRILALQVENPEQYGVLKFGDEGELIDILEKPTQPPSQFIIPGLYIFDKSVSEHAKALTPSPRGELEITDLIRIYLKKGNLEVRHLDNDAIWFDMGTHESLFKASEYVRALRLGY